jgi:hypothetical protein
MKSTARMQPFRSATGGAGLPAMASSREVGLKPTTTWCFCRRGGLSLAKGGAAPTKSPACQHRASTGVVSYRLSRTSCALGDAAAGPTDHTIQAGEESSTHKETFVFREQQKGPARLARAGPG